MTVKKTPFAWAVLILSLIRCDTAAGRVAKTILAPLACFGMSLSVSATCTHADENRAKQLNAPGDWANDNK